MPESSGTGVMKDYYFILQVDSKASQEEIRKAHRRLVLRYHPDMSGEPDAAKFREVQEAYEILGDEEKRKAYNHERKTFEQRRRASEDLVYGRPVRLFEDFGTIVPGLDEIFDHIRRNFFGLSRKVEPVRDLHVEVILDPEEAALGGDLPLEVPLYLRCPRCGGSGGDFPFLCSICRGEGWQWAPRKVTIQIPPGVRDGSLFRFGLGHFGIHNLHLDVTIRVAPYSY